MVVTAVQDVFSREMGVPGRVITGMGSEFVSTDTRALLESQLGVKMAFIPPRLAPTELGGVCTPHTVGSD